MSYTDAITAVGIEILAYQSFGDWQGTYVYHVSYNGQTGWLFVSYGSCSGCDSWESYRNSLGGYDYECTLQDLVDFGRPYINRIMSAQEALKNAGQDVDWDLEQEPMLNFVKSRINTVPVKKKKSLGTLGDLFGAIRIGNSMSERARFIMDTIEN